MSPTPSRTNPQSVFGVLVALLLLALLARAWMPPAYDVPEVGTAQARALLDDGAVVVDVRPQDAYGKRHLPGALSIPLERLRDGIPESLAFAKAKPVVVYCGDGVARGRESTHLLRQAGYTGTVNLAGGLGAWTGAGLPLAK
jgi:rhodanese-related sulfurtransferase